MARITLKSGHVRPVWAGHPWVFEQAVEQLAGGATAGDEVDVVDPGGRLLGRGLYSPGSAIPVRIYTRGASGHVTPGLFIERIRRAVRRRSELGLPTGTTTAYRVVNAEGDDLPGLIVDRFGDTIVLQLGTIGMSRRKQLILDAIDQVLRPRAIVDRTAAATAKAEGFSADRGVVRGDESIQDLVFAERGLRYRIPLELGQKTGFYVDQRPLRSRVEELSRNRRVLDAFAFVGAFALAAARGGAREVVAIESSILAHEAAVDCARLNDLAEGIVFQHGDARQGLADAAKGDRFDLVVCDPPKLAAGRRHKKRALASMRRMAAAACRAARPGGLLVLCTCSAAIRLEELSRCLALGARDAGVAAYVFERHFQGADHPVPAAFPEGLYLSSLIAEVHQVP